MGLEIDDAARMIRIAAEKEDDAKLWQRWIPYQSEMSYEEFKKKVLIRPIKTEEQSTETIMDTVKSILNLMQGGGEDGTI